MKKLLVIALGLGLAIGSVSFAQQDDSTKKEGKKKGKKGKKGSDDTDSNKKM